MDPPLQHPLNIAANLLNNNPLLEHLIHQPGAEVEKKITIGDNGEATVITTITQKMNGDQSGSNGKVANTPVPQGMHLDTGTATNVFPLLQGGRHGHAWQHPARTFALPYTGAHNGTKYMKLIFFYILISI